LAAVITVYLTVEPSEAAIPPREAAQLCVEAYRYLAVIKIWLPTYYL
jgi:hypothetical protein